MTDPTNIRAMVFDAYGTLFNINSLDHRLEEYFGAQSSELSAIWRKKQLEYTWLRTLMGRYKPFSEVTMDALAYGCDLLGLSMSDSIKNDLGKRYLRLDAYPEVPEILKTLSGKFSLGVLSNANIEMLQGAVTHNKLNAYFSHILSVESVRVFKPRAEVYQLACDAFGLAPQEVLFISSNTWDVAGAKCFGLKVARLNRSGMVAEVLGFEEDHELGSMSDLLEF